MIVIGIDPGLSGAIALLSNGVFQGVEDMPTVPKGTGRKQQVNAAALAELLRDYDAGVIYVERVSAMPKQGVSSTFAFGESFGVIRGVASALCMSLEFVTPQVWKRRFRLVGADKDLARTKASELHPTAPLARKKDIGRADAILIARYGWELEQQRREAA